MHSATSSTNPSGWFSTLFATRGRAGRRLRANGLPNANEQRPIQTADRYQATKPDWERSCRMKRVHIPAAAAVLATLSALCLTSVAEAAPACEPAKLAEKYPGLAGRTIKIGVDPQTPPYVMRPANDFAKLIGVDADVARAVFDCAGVKYEFVAGAWSGLLPAVRAGQLDVLWDNLYYNPERGKILDFVIYMEAGTGAMTQAGNPKKIISKDAMCGAVAAVTLGGFEESIVKEADATCKAAGKPGVEMMSFQDVAAGIRLIDNKRADIMMWDAGLIDTLVAENPGKYDRAFMTLSGIQIGPAVRKDDQDLLKAIFDGMTVLQAKKEQAAIFKKYNVDPSSQVTAVIKNEK
ncbi:ABC transporter substrate-binding protein [Ancylobacter sp. A5.8]|uniref:ABC transporter substrate-binding protein n=1 Tax=Ancylobacter gelatini TaxID=2919920 RepID=UPI001F4DFB80|nr:ABC transporter substrate-binding protein [Ancylobacter gelatini]MCJ8142330.1 ABC transporter substrate-binding protein [Ancylobacter gelatini]